LSGGFGLLENWRVFFSVRMLLVRSTRSGEKCELGFTLEVGDFSWLAGWCVGIKQLFHT